MESNHPNTPMNKKEPGQGKYEQTDRESEGRVKGDYRGMKENMYKGATNKDNGEGIVFGKRVGQGRGEQRGGNEDNCN